MGSANPSLPVGLDDLPCSRCRFCMFAFTTTREPRLPGVGATVETLLGCGSSSFVACLDCSHQRQQPKGGSSRRKSPAWGGAQPDRPRKPPSVRGRPEAELDQSTGRSVRVRCFWGREGILAACPGRRSTAVYMPPANTPNPTNDESAPANRPYEAVRCHETPSRCASAIAQAFLESTTPIPGMAPGHLTTQPVPRRSCTRNADSSTRPSQAPTTTRASSRRRFWRNHHGDLAIAPSSLPNHHQAIPGEAEAPLLLARPSGVRSRLIPAVPFLLAARALGAVRLVAAALLLRSSNTPIRLWRDVNHGFTRLIRSHCHCFSGCRPGGHLAVALLGGENYDSRDSFRLPQPESKVICRAQRRPGGPDLRKICHHPFPENLTLPGCAMATIARADPQGAMNSLWASDRCGFSPAHRPGLSAMASLLIRTVILCSAGHPGLCSPWSSVCPLKRGPGTTPVVKERRALEAPPQRRLPSPQRHPL